MLWLNSCRVRSRKMTALFTDTLLFQVKCRTPQTIQERLLLLAVIKRTTSLSKLSTHPDIMLKELSRKMENPKEDIPLWLSNYQQRIQEVFKIPLDHHLMSHREWVVHNFQKDELMNMSVRSPDFDNVINILDCHIDSLPVNQLPFVLKCLTSLYVPEDNSYMVKLYQKCIGNLHSFEVHELTLFTQCAFVSGKTDVCAQILQNLQGRLVRQKIPFTSSSSDLCVLFRCLGHLMSQRMMGLCASFIVTYITKKSVIDFSSLRLLCELAESGRGEVKEIIQERMVQSEFLSLNIAFDFEKLDMESCSLIGRHFDTLFAHTPLQSKIRHLWFKDFLSEDSPVSPAQALSLFFLPSKHLSIHSLCKELKLTKEMLREKFSDPLEQSIKDSDNQKLIWFLRLLHHQSKMPWKALSVLQDRLTSIFDEQSLEEQQWLLEQDEEILVLLYSFVQTLVHFDFDVSDQLISVISRQFSKKRLVPPVSKAKAPLLVHGIISTLSKDTPLSAKNARLFSSVLNQLSISSLIYLSGKLKIGLRKGAQSLSQNVIFSMRTLAQQTNSVLQDKLSSAHPLPANVLSEDFDNIWSLSKGVVWHSGILQTVGPRLNRLTQESDEVNCMRAIEILSSFTSFDFSIFKPSLFENILQFIYTSQPTPMRASVLLLHVVSSGKYKPKDFHRFTSFFSNLQEDVRDRNLLSHAQQVLLAYCLSLYKIYDDKALYSIFSMDFLLAFEREMENALYLPGRRETFYYNCLHSLNRSVAVECPHLAISLFTSPSNGTGQHASQEFINSIQRIFHYSPHIQLGTQSAYGHRIDALVCLDENCDIVDLHASESSISYKLAFLFLRPKDFCFPIKDRQSGHMKALVRQLKLLGYFVVEVPYYRLSGMDMNSHEAMDNYCREQIIRAIGPQFLFSQS